MDQKEFINIITPFKDKIFRVAKRLLVSTEEAEDATQDIIVKLWDKKSTLKNYNNIEAFAITITKNHCLDQLKSKRVSNLKIVHTNYASNDKSIDKNIEDEDSVNWIEKEINNLPEQQKLIVQMRDIEEFEFEKIAEILNMNETAVRVALSRARKTIRENMIKIYNYGIT